MLNKPQNDWKSSPNVFISICFVMGIRIAVISRSIPILFRYVIVWFLIIQISHGNNNRKYSGSIRAAVGKWIEEGKFEEVVLQLQRVDMEYHTLCLDSDLPSFYNILGIAFYETKMVHEAFEAFRKAVHYNPNDSRAWINLGELQEQSFDLRNSVFSFERAYNLGETAALPRMIRAKGWSMDWKNMDYFASQLEVHSYNCNLDFKRCTIDSTGGFEYTDLSGVIYKYMTAQTTGSRTLSLAHHTPAQACKSELLSCKNTPQPHDHTMNFQDINIHKRLPRLKLGFISSDFGTHPVATLIRGMIQSLDKQKHEIFCFALLTRSTWWGKNISESVEHYVELGHDDSAESVAVRIQSHQLDILVDLNGHTLNSGLPIMAYRIAPIQMSFLGSPSTTAAEFIDYFVADKIALPPEHADHFTEHLVLMNTCYIVNDYAQTQGAIRFTDAQYRAPRISLRNRDTSIDSLYSARILFGTLATAMKVDPSIFHVWMNIMRVFSGSKMMFLQYGGYETFYPNILQQAAHFGIAKHRLLLSPILPWADHILAKTSIDLLFDTYVKNTHTTGLDGIWAGVPTVTLAGGDKMAQRAGESIAHTLESELGVAFSLKDYEDLALSLMKNLHRRSDREKRDKQRRYLKAMNMFNQEKENVIIDRNHNDDDAEATFETNNDIVFSSKDIHSSIPRRKSVSFEGSKTSAIHQQLHDEYPLLVKWREIVTHRRSTSRLFNTRLWTKQFEHLLQAVWELNNMKFSNSDVENSASKGRKLYHIIAKSEEKHVNSESTDVLYQMSAEDSRFFPSNVNTTQDSLKIALASLLEEEMITLEGS